MMRLTRADGWTCTIVRVNRARFRVTEFPADFGAADVQRTRDEPNLEAALESCVVAGYVSKRGRGRPSKGDATRNKIVGVRFTAGGLAALESAAAGEGVTASEWVRRRALDALGIDD